MKTNASGGEPMPSSRDNHASAVSVLESASMVTPATSQLTEYSTRTCARRSCTSTSTMSAALRNVTTFNSRVIDSMGDSIRALRFPSPEFPFQHVDKDPQQHVDNTINRFQRRDTAFPGTSRPDMAGHFLKAKRPSL